MGIKHIEEKPEILFVKRKTSLDPWIVGRRSGWRSERQGEGVVAQIGEHIPGAAVTCSCQHFALRFCWLLVEAEAEQSWGGARHLSLKLPTQLPLIDTGSLAS